MSGYKAMAYQTLRVREQPGIRFVQLYRPEAQNALNTRLIHELTEILGGLEDNPSVNVVVLEGLPDVFCSGMDFQEYVNLEGDGELRMADTFTLFRKLAESSKIIVAKVQGKVNAGGIGLVAASDLVVAESTAFFALPELLFGLLPAMVLPFLIRRVGHQRAKLLALSTQPIGAAEAHRWGLVDVYGAELDQLLLPYLQRWRRLSPLSIRKLKTYMNQLQPIDNATQTLAVKTIAAAMGEAEVKAGIRRYVEDGSAPWSQ
ncbi:enoyl-CoA hydratase/isomerase [soil metagenome]